MTRNEDMVELFAIDFGEPIFVWKTSCPGCGLEEPKVALGDVPRCWHCRALLGTDDVLRWPAQETS